MQIDMHYYCSYAVARLAGLQPENANIIATSAQFVDDATNNDSEKNKNQEMLFAISTAHHIKGAAITSHFHPEFNRLVWVPFHFYPGGEGTTLEEKLLCTMDGKIANRMFDNHITMHDKAYYLYLIGIATHVYMDTFSHYGFSGINSDLNKIVDTTLIAHGKGDFFDRLQEKAMAIFKSNIAEIGSDGLGHGAVGTYPDKPYLEWEFSYEEPRYNNMTSPGRRKNQDTFLTGIERLYEKLSAVARNMEQPTHSEELPIDELKDILKSKGNKKERSELWQEFIKSKFGDTVEYGGEEWNKQKDQFGSTPAPDHIGHCYRFHQAATYHRWYTLKDLLPEFEIYSV